MYIPKQYNVDDIEKQVQIIKDYPLGTLFSSRPVSKGLFGFGKGDESEQPDSDMCASHIPFFFVESPEGKHKLIAHLSAKNQHANQLENTSKCLVTFQSVDSYISPSWYPLKEKTHKFVPTWDFAAVHVYGTPKIIRGDKEWLLKMLNLLTNQEEGKRPEGEEFKAKWKVSDAPESFLDGKLKGIIGLEIDITHMESKFKFDQDSSQINVDGVISNLENEVGGDKGGDMAKFTKECYPDRK
ncbi:ZYRO0E00462p [Zygosaccharomyces rouxii]|uniref:ZYRO0E00462p n=1 Tax=Zygosaccharomyces rouxii (strain ATCC 2623 / CBS 732 / NBRC 1130 / NCYC 568 / NRRL Y-229) TaxID=559307 RepID=C5E3V1_ZYGRC|nr:uncharacterized protein ZYRO0E00462g [Zygosaccharomyces rouxii]KAH9198425.1 transcriptional regulator PAI 2-type [Zygosaccharomyces rouxii]CAR30712.1 ZYRO0E00462p [Zygosaccharomyces rouxii]